LNKGVKPSAKTIAFQLALIQTTCSLSINSEL